MARFLRSSFFVLAAVLFSVELAAAAIVRPASSSDVFVKGGQTLNINNHWGEILDVPFTSGTKRVDVPVVQNRGFAWGRVGGWIKGAIKANPGKIAVTAGVLWLIDQIPGASFDPLTGQLMKSPPGAPSSLTYWQNLTNRKYGMTADEACSPYTATPIGAGSTARCNNPYDYVTAARATINCQYGVDLANYKCFEKQQPQPAPIPMTDSDLDQLASNASGIPESIWNNGFGSDLGSIPGTFDGPDVEDFTGPPSIDLPSTTTTTTDHATGDVTVTESIPSVTFEYATSPLNITATPSTTTNTYTNGSKTSSSTTTAPSVNSTSSGGGGGGGDVTIEIPTDCDFMPTVCAFIDWVKTPFDEDEVDLAEYIEDEDFTKQVTFSGNASCPPPTIISTEFGDQVFDWSPGCQWAEMLKPLIILGALLAALYISLGIGRSD